MIGADLVRAALPLSLVWPQGPWHAYLVAAVLAGGNTYFNATVQAVIPALTTETQRLAANSVAFSTGRLLQIVASAVAGILIAVVGTATVFGLNAVTFVISALLISRLPIPRHAGQVDPEGRRGLERFWGDALAGVRFARNDYFVSRLLLVQLLASFAVGATGALLAERHLRLPPEGLAWLIGAIGVGALLGPLIPNALARDYRDARWLFVPYVIRASAGGKRQSIAAGAALRAVVHAATSVSRMARSGTRRVRHWRLRTESAISAMVSHLPGVGCGGSQGGWRSAWPRRAGRPRRARRGSGHRPAPAHRAPNRSASAGC